MTLLQLTEYLAVQDPMTLLCDYERNQLYLTAPADVPWLHMQGFFCSFNLTLAVQEMAPIYLQYPGLVIHLTSYFNSVIF